MQDFDSLPCQKRFTASAIQLFWPLGVSELGGRNIPSQIRTDQTETAAFGLQSQELTP
jgi:hypothetical protein